MIRSIAIRNFQSHPDTKLALTPGVNVIVGQSDSGKSAILRALRWVLTDRPLGTSQRSDWGGDTVVEIVTTDEQARTRLGPARDVVRRVRSDSANRYELNSTPMICNTNGPPQPVLDALNMAEVNSQAQLDSPFLMSLSPGEAAKRLNEVANLEVIDRSLSGVAALVRQATADARTCEARSEELAAELERTEWVKDARREVTVLSERRDKWCDALKAASTLKYLLEDVIPLQERLSKLPDHRRMAKDVAALMERGEALWRLKEKACALGLASERATAVEHNIERLGGMLDDVARKWKSVAPKTCPLCGGKLGGLK